MKTLSYTVAGGILTLLYTFFLLQFICFLLCIEKRQQKLSLYAFAALVFSGISLVFMRVFNERAEQGFAPPREPYLPQMEKLPLWAAAVYLLVLGAVTFWLIYKTWKFHQNTLTRSAIRESFDNLPTGLCFSEADGFVLLANRTMEKLCFQLTGQDLQDAEDFWKKLSTGIDCKAEERIDAQITACKDQPCFRLKDQEIWTFQQDFIQQEENRIIQLTAVNITELYQLSQKVKDTNEQLARMNQRLKQYSVNMDTLVKSRELLETKVNIHREMGQALLASHAYLAHNAPDLTEKDILKRWESVIMLLKKEADPPGNENEWKQFLSAAGEAGVQIKTKGPVPTDPVQLEYLLMAAAEALTNAVRHAGADRLYIDISENSQYQLTVQFSNNGKHPDGKVKEGGGLGALRMRLEDAGGAMEIYTDPQFVLAVILPPKGDSHDTHAGFDRRR